MSNRRDPVGAVRRATFTCAIGISLWLAAGMAPGMQIAYEGFEYAPGKVTGMNGGQGWDGGWFASPLNKADNAVAEGGLTFGNLAASGNKLIENAGDVRSFRRIDTSRRELAELVDDGPGGKVLGKDDTTVWIGFLISCDSYPATAYGGIHLCDGLGDLAKDAFGDKRAHQRISMGRQNVDTHWYLGRVTSGAPGKGEWSSKVTADAAVRFLVYRFDFKKGPEEAWTWIDPPLDGEPKADDAAIHAKEVADFRFDTLSVGAGESTRFFLDEIRIGTSFRDVAPPAAARGSVQPSVTSENGGASS